MGRKTRGAGKQGSRGSGRAFTATAALRMASLFSLGYGYDAVASTFVEEHVAPPSRNGFYNVIKRHKAGKPLTGGVKQPTITQGTIDLVERLINEDPRRYAREIEEILFDKHHLVVSRQSILNILHTNLGLTKTKLDIRASQRQTASRMRLLAAYGADGFDSRMAIWIDESHITPDIQRTEAWAPRGCSATLAAYLSGDQRYSYMGAVNCGGMVEPACQLLRVGDGHGNVDAERFNLWARRRLLPELGSCARCEPNSILVLDNCRFHHNDEFVAMVEGVGCKILYLSAYSPDFNPIELCFAIMKKRLGSLFTSAGGAPIEDRVADAAASITASTACKLIRRAHAGKDLPADVGPEDDAVPTLVALAALT